MCYNKINQIWFGQWKENEVVSFIATLILVGDVVATCWCGEDEVKFTCSKALKAYSKFMGYEDLVDLDLKISGRVFKQRKFQEMVKSNNSIVFWFHYCEW